MRISSQPPLVHCIYMCACIPFWLISVFLFSRIYYGFTPLRHHMSRQFRQDNELNIVYGHVIEDRLRLLGINTLLK